MKRILAFGGSTSSTSINKQFAHYAAQQIENVELTLIDLNDYETPLFNVDLEKSIETPESVIRFKAAIEATDGLVVSLAEHNGNFAAAFKNLMDWTSRLEGKIWSEKKMFLLATSPGGRGGLSVLEIALAAFPRYGAMIEASFSLPLFYDNFGPEGIKNEELADAFSDQLRLFVKSLS